MAITRFSLTPRVRSAGQVAQRAVQYLTREGPYAPAHTVEPAQREVGYLVRETEATRARDDLVWQQVGNLPAWAQGSASRFFEAAAAYERVNGRWGMALQAALPRELSREQQLALTHDFLQAHLPDKPYLVVMHEPRTATGETQPHIHVLFSERRMDSIARDAQQFFKRANPDHPERGGAAKDRFWNERRCPGRIRQAWVDLTNYHLERAGHDVRIDARSLHARGIAREPERKAGWQHEGHDYREGVRTSRLTTAEVEHALAHKHWEHRKEVLGITNVHELSPEAMQEKSRTWARDGAPGRAIPLPTLDQLQERQETMHAKVAQGEQVLERMEAAVRRAEHHERTHTIPSWDEVKQTAAVLEHAVSIGLLDDDTPQRGATLKRGWDKSWAEQQRTQGRGLQR